MKKAHQYKLRLEQTASTQPDAALPQPLEFTFTNHDDLFQLLERVNSRQLFSEADTREFLLGLKLLTEVMLRNRDHDLFTEFQPAVGQFMKKLKGN